MIDPVLLLVLSWCIALLFIGAAADKVFGWGGFLATLAEYQLLPERTIVPAAVSVVLLEACAGVGLLFAPLRANAAYLAAALLVSYGLAIWINLLRGRVHIDCGCIGGRASVLSHWLLLRNAVLTLAALLCALPATGRTLGWIDFLSVAGGVTVLAMLYLGINLLLSYHFEQNAWGLTDD